MILITDLCYRKDSLSYYEYVNPICEIAEDSGSEYDVIHYSELNGEIPDKYSSVIFCGTALKDNLFIEDLSLMQAVRSYNKPVIGICAGMQVIASAYGGKITDLKKFGMSRVRFSPGDPIFCDIPDQIIRSGITDKENGNNSFSSLSSGDICQKNNSSTYVDSGRPVYEFEGYEVHSRMTELPDSFIPLAMSGVGHSSPEPSEVFRTPVSFDSEIYPEIIRHREKPVYGILFHPEVRNVWLIRNFINLSGEGEF